MASARFKRYYNLPCNGRCPTCGGALVRMLYGGGIMCRDWRRHDPEFGGYWRIPESRPRPTLRWVWATPTTEAGGR